MTIKKDSNSPMSNLKSTQVSAVFEDENALKSDESGDRLKPEEAVTDASDSDVPAKDAVISDIPDSNPLGINRLVRRALADHNFMASLPPEKLPDGWKGCESVKYEPTPEQVKRKPLSTIPAMPPVPPLDNELPDTKKIPMLAKPIVTVEAVIPPSDQLPETRKVDIKEKSPEVIAAENSEEFIPVTIKVDMREAAKATTATAISTTTVSKATAPEEDDDDVPSTKKIDLPVKK